MGSETHHHSSSQETYLLNTLSLINRIIFYKLGTKHRDSVEDVKQQVFLKLWRWKRARSDRNLSEQEWRNLASVTTYNEVLDFFSATNRRPILFSQIDKNIEELELSILSSSKNPESPHSSGPISTETQSLLLLVWNSAQDLTLRQKYAFFLHNQDIIVDFISAECCSIKELANYFESTEESTRIIVESDSLPDKQIAELVEKKLKKAVSPKSIWEARGRAKAKIAKKLAEALNNGGTSDERRT